MCEVRSLPWATLRGPCLILLSLGAALSSGPARAEWVTRNIQVGNLPRAIGIDPFRNRVYVALENGGSVFIYEPFDDAGGEKTVGSSPNAVAVNPLTHRVYIANQQSASVSVYDELFDTVVATVTVGNNPYALVINPVTNRIFVANRLSNSVTVIRGSDNTVETTISVGSDPRSLTVNPLTNKIYVANRASNNVTVIDGTTFARTTVGVGSTPNAICVNPTTNFIYVANQGSSSVTRIDGATNATTTIGAGNNPYAIASDPVSNRIYVANVAAGTVTAINGTTNATATVTVGVNPVSIAVNPATNRAYVCNLGSTFLSMIDGATNATTSLTVGSSALCAAINPYTQKLYVARNIGSGDGLVEVDLATNAVSSVATTSGPSAVAVNRRTHRGYLAFASANQVTEIDLQTGLASATVATGANPRAVLADELRNVVWVANRQSGTVTRVNGQTHATQTITTDAGSCALALDERNNRVFVANADGNSVTLINGANLSTTTIPVDAAPASLAWDPTSGACFVACRMANTVVRIDGQTHATERIPVGPSPAVVAVDPLTQAVFVSISMSAVGVTIGGMGRVIGYVSRINAATHRVDCNIPVYGLPVAVVVDPVRGQVFVADSMGSSITQIREADETTREIVVGSSPHALSLAQWSGKLYAGCLGSSQLSIVDLGSLATATIPVLANTAVCASDDIAGRVLVGVATGSQATLVVESGVVGQPLTSAVDPLAGDLAQSNQEFTGGITSSRSPATAGITGSYLALDTPARPWLVAGVIGAGGTSATWDLPAVPMNWAGEHLIRVAALDQTSGTLDNSSQAAGTVFAGSAGAYLCDAASTFVPSPPPGTRPVINVEIDWLVAGDHSHRPSECELDGVRVAFFRSGYDLNLEWSDAIPEDATNRVIDFDATHGFDSAAGEWATIEQTYRNHPPGTGWHYCLFGHRFSSSGVDGGNSGISEVGPDGGGDELLISLGDAPGISFGGPAGSPFDRAATFMHELGHNLSLKHSGSQAEGDVGQFKPNFPSVMCYRYQLTGVRSGMQCQNLATSVPPFQELDYSHGTLGALDETALDESLGLGFGGVDWDCSGTVSGVVGMDVSSPGSGPYPAINANWCANSGARNILTDSDDWSRVRDFTCADHVGSGTSSFSASSTLPVCVSAPVSDRLLAAAFVCIQPNPCALSGVPPLSPGPLPVAVGSAAPNPFSTTTHIVLDLPRTMVVDASVADIAGRAVAPLQRARLSSGPHALTWDGRDSAGRPARSGVYFIRVFLDGRLSTRRVIIVR